MGGRGSLRGDRAWGKGGVAGGLEQGGWNLARVSKGLGGWGLERAEGLGSGGLDPQGTGRTDVCLFACSEGQKFPLCSMGRCSLLVRCPKGWQFMVKGCLDSTTLTGSDI